VHDKGVTNGTEAEGDGDQVVEEEEGNGDLDEEEVDEEEEGMCCGVERSTEESDVVGNSGGGQEIPSGIEGFGTTSTLAPEECAGNRQDGMNTLHVRSQIGDLIDSISWRLKVLVAILNVSEENRSRLKDVSITVEQLKALLISAEFAERT
jgi:hypothetical protein